MNPELRKMQILFKALLCQKSCCFPKPDERLEAPIEQGVYVIYDAKQVVVHVGKTSKAKGGLKQRLGNHMQGKSSFARKYLKGEGRKLRGKYTFKYILVSDPRLRTLFEAYVTSHLCPKHLGVGISD